MATIDDQIQGLQRRLDRLNELKSAVVQAVIMGGTDHLAGRLHDLYCNRCKKRHVLDSAPRSAPQNAGHEGCPFGTGKFSGSAQAEYQKEKEAWVSLASGIIEVLRDNPTEVEARTALRLIDLGRETAHIQ